MWHLRTTKALSDQHSEIAACASAIHEVSSITQNTSPMKHICLFAAALFLLSCQEELSSDTNSLAEFTPSGDTVIFYLQPGVNAFTLPACAGYYNCPSIEHMDIDCNA